MRLRGGLHVGRFRHHLFVEGGADCRIQQNDVVAAELAGLQRALRDLHRLLACDDGQCLDGEIAAGTVDVWRMPLRCTFSAGSKQATVPSAARAAMIETSRSKATKLSRMRGTAPRAA